MSTLKKEKEKGSSVDARTATSPLAAFLSRIGAKGRQKLTIMLIPHSEKRIVRIQMSFFALGGLLFFVVALAGAFIFSAARFSDTAGKLQSRSSDLASTRASLEAIQKQTSDLVTAARRFESALSGTLDRVGSKPASATASVQGGDPVSFFDSSTRASAAAPEAEDLERLSAYLEKSVGPLKDLGSLLKSQSIVLTEIPNIWPVKGASHIAMYYGQDENPFTGQWYVNSGVDISTYRTGDPVVATADGKVASLGYDSELGNYCVIQHSHGFVTRYGHLMAFRVSKGQKVQQGQIIGLLGNTGLTTGPQLHYEVHLGTGVVDPQEFLNIRAAATAAE